MVRTDAREVHERVTGWSEACSGSHACSLQKERVSVGDVIYIEANSGATKRVGRCDAYATEFDLEAEEYVPLPKARA